MEFKQPEKELKQKFLRTLLRSDVYDRLESYAQCYCTGLGKWDFGIAIERLLDTCEIHDKFDMIESRLSLLESQSDKEQDKVKEKPKEVGLLGKNKTEEI